MAYEKITWYDSPDTSTPLNAENLNRLEDGVEAANNAASANAGDIDKLEERMDTAESNISTAETNIATLSSDKEDVSNKWVFNYNMTSDAIRNSLTYYASNYYVEKCVTSKINEALASEDLKVDLSGYDSAISDLNTADTEIWDYLGENVELLDNKKSTYKDIYNALYASGSYSTTYYPSINGMAEYVNNTIADLESTDNKLTAMPENNTTDENYSDTKYPSAKAVYDFVDSTVSDLGDLSSKEDVSNKRSSITAGTSTRTDYYPSNKAVVSYLKDNYCSKALYRLPVSVAFDENYIPLKITDSTTLSGGSLNVTGAKYAFVANDVTSLQAGTFSSTITDIYVDQSSTSSVVSAATTNAPDGATVYDQDGIMNADEFLLRAIYNLYNTLKVSEITDDNSASTDYYPSNKAVANYVDTAITNFENTWDFESLCNDVDNLSSSFESLCNDVDNLRSSVDTLTSKVTSTNNMIYFKRGTTSWDEDIYIYFWNAAPSNFSNRYQANPSNNGANMGFKMTLVDEENGIYAYPRLNYTHMRFACTKVTDAEDLYYTTSDMLVPLPTQEKMPCYYQSSIGYDGIWGDLANDNVRIYLQSLTNSIPTVTADSGNLTVYPIGCTGNSVSGRTSYYYYVDVPADSEEVLTITISGISTESSVFESCYNHTVFYCTGEEYIGYFNGDVDKYFSELIGYDTSKYLS